MYILQLVRIGRICTFLNRHYKLTQRQRYQYSDLCMAFKRFVISCVSTFSKYGCSIRRHMKEGICLPPSEVAVSLSDYN